MEDYGEIQDGDPRTKTSMSRTEKINKSRTSSGPGVNSGPNWTNNSKNLKLWTRSDQDPEKFQNLGPDGTGTEKITKSRTGRENSGSLPSTYLHS